MGGCTSYGRVSVGEPSQADWDYSVIKVIHKYYDNSLEVNEILLMRGVDLLIKALQNIGEANRYGFMSSA